MSIFVNQFFLIGTGISKSLLQYFNTSMDAIDSDGVNIKNIYFITMAYWFQFLEFDLQRQC